MYIGSCHRRRLAVDLISTICHRFTPSANLYLEAGDHHLRTFTPSNNNPPDSPLYCVMWVCIAVELIAVFLGLFYFTQRHDKLKNFLV